MITYGFFLFASSHPGRPENAAAEAVALFEGAKETAALVVENLFP